METSVPETSQSVTGACQGCVLWKRAEAPADDESAEYQDFRRCVSVYRPGLAGRQILNEAGQLLTAPDARCGYFVSRGGER
jgi:hypothetical protein